MMSINFFAFTRGARITITLLEKFIDVRIGMTELTYRCCIAKGFEGDSRFSKVGNANCLGKQSAA